MELFIPLTKTPSASDLAAYRVNDIETAVCFSHTWDGEGGRGVRVISRTLTTPNIRFMLLLSPKGSFGIIYSNKAVPIKKQW